jgi:hypothetical protein
MRQDPPFDMHYITATHLLERVHPKTLVVNDPTSVRNAPEKIFVTEFPASHAGHADHARSGRDRGLPQAEHGDIVMKPLYGNGGAACSRSARTTRISARCLDHFLGTFREPWVMPALPAGGARGRQAHHPRRRRLRRARSTACRRRMTSAPTWCAAGRPSRPISAREQEICDPSGRS